MGWPVFSDPVALWAVTVSAVSAIAMFAMLSALVVRRWILERGKARRSTQARALVRQFVAMTNDEPYDEAIIASAGTDERIEAVIHIYQLVRGQERDRLRDYVKQNDVLAPIRRRARRGSPNRRIEAVRLLEWIGEEKSVLTLRLVLNNEPNLLIRLEAAAALAHIGGLPPPRALIGLLDLDKQAPTRLHRAIFRASAARHLHAMTALLTDEKLHDDTRVLVIDALGWSENFDALPALAEAARHPDHRVRSAALRAARQLGHPAARSWVIALLADEHDKVRTQAILTCMHMDMHEALPVIEQLAADPSPWVRYRADQGLRRLARKAAS